MCFIRKFINGCIREYYTPLWRTYGKLYYVRCQGRTSLVRKAICRIYQEYAVRPRIMAKKTWLTAKLCRGLSWNRVDSRLRTIDASPSLSSLSPLRVRNCTRDHRVRAHAYVSAFADSENTSEQRKREREREEVIRGEAERMRGPSFLSRASASEIGAYDMQPFAYI